MKVYIFGNPDLIFDRHALAISKHYQSGKRSELAKHLDFVFVNPNADLPFAGEEHVVIIDGIAGIETVTVLHEAEISRLQLTPRTTVHDFDLGFQLKYLQKIKKLGKVTLIGLPLEQPVDYDSVHSILRKLVEQDMHGS